MAHLVLAAQQLIDQIEEVAPNASIKVLDEEDGLGFARSIQVDTATGKRLEPALAVLGDERIADVSTTKKGLVVTFVADTRADFPTRYELAEVLAVLED